MWLGLAGRGRGQGPHRRRPRLPARRLGLPQPAARRAPERRLRPHADAPVPVRRLPPRAPEGARRLDRPARRRDRRQGRQGGRLPPRALLRPRRSASATARDESHRRMQAALDALWPYTGEMFLADDKDAEVAAAGIAPDPASLRPAWEATVARRADRGDADDPRERASPTRAASAASTPSISATSSPTCSSCSAPIPAPPGEDER